jgi:hypothetical protein
MFCTAVQLLPLLYSLNHDTRLVIPWQAMYRPSPHYVALPLVSVNQ